MPASRLLQWNPGWAAAFCLVAITLQAQEAWERDHDAGVKAAKAAQFSEAEGLLLRSADEARKTATAASLLARSLLDLGEVYRSEGKYAPAQSCYAEALQIYTKQYGADSPQAAEVLNGQAGKAAEAENRYQQAVRIYGKTVGGEHPDYANALEGLALFYSARRQYDLAEPLLARILEIREKVFGPDHHDVGVSLDALGL